MAVEAAAEMLREALSDVIYVGCEGRRPRGAGA